MNRPEPHPHTYLENRALLLLLVAVSLALGWILLPLYGTILWGAIIALLFSPLYHRLLRPLKQRRTVAALVTLLIVVVIVILPLALVTASLAREASAVYERTQSGEWNPALYFKGVFAALPEWALSLLDRFGLANFDTLQRRLAAGLAQGSQFIAKQALSIGQNTFEFIAGLFITLYLAFFLIRDGESVTRSVQRAIPLAPAHKRELLGKFATVIRATVKGNLLVAVLQGALGGLAFWFLDVNGALLWAVLMAFLSLLPAVGASLVWLPVAIYFFVTGELWQGSGAGRLRRARDRLGRQRAAAGAGGQGHAHARLCGDDHHARWHGGVRHQRFRSRPRDRGDVHRRLAHLHDDPAPRLAVGAARARPKARRLLIWSPLSMFFCLLAHWIWCEV